jgi:GxxExxY protein
MDVREPGEVVNEWSRRVIGAAIEVHRDFGPGYPERAYGDALEVELGLQEIPFAREVRVERRYKGVVVFSPQLDFLIADLLVVELKAVEGILPVHHYQVRSYLRATRLDLGLLLNFNVPSLRLGIHRIVQT